MEKRKHYTPEQHRIHNKRYNKLHTKLVAFRFNLNTDADILAHLEKLTNKLGYIKELIREDMKRNPL